MEDRSKMGRGRKSPGKEEERRQEKKVKIRKDNK